MRRREFSLLLSGIVTLLSVSSAAAMETGYFSVKGGAFLPNSKGGGSGNSLQTFDSGYDAEVAVGFRPEPYAAIEIGTGFYTASGTVTDAGSRSEKTLYGIPLTATAKAILDLDKVELFAGAGVGYYFAFIDNKIDFSNGGIAPVQESSHNSALGYHLLLGADYKVSRNFRLGADFKWFVVETDLELTDTSNVKRTSNWDLGGAVMNVGLKYLY